ncbi:trehalose-6-phosphate synthase [Komagataeibacter rhaeticus]|nr:trehalose-6-phosphate synthase [Komagataeibacter rhaeticus]
MNLVAKEFIAAQDPENPGVLILSRLAGAAKQLDAAILVNPLDHDDMADALERAMVMSAAERRERWQSCWNSIASRTALGWGLSFLNILEGRNRRARPRSSPCTPCHGRDISGHGFSSPSSPSGYYPYPWWRAAAQRGGIWRGRR